MSPARREHNQQREGRVKALTVSGCGVDVHNSEKPMKSVGKSKPKERETTGRQCGGLGSE